MLLSVVLAVGLPGSGKSKYFVDLHANPISSDALRLQLADDETDQTIHSQVFAAMRYLLHKRIELARPATYIDATNITRQDRRPFIQIARETGCAIEAVYFDTPLAICKARNAARPRVVPESALDLMAARLVPPSVDEGFSRVEVVRYLPGNPPSASAG